MLGHGSPKAQNQIKFLQITCTCNICTCILNTFCQENIVSSRLLYIVYPTETPIVQSVPIHG